MNARGTTRPRVRCPRSVCLPSLSRVAAPRGHAGTRARRASRGASRRPADRTRPGHGWTWADCRAADWRELRNCSDRGSDQCAVRCARMRVCTEYGRRPLRARPPALPFVRVRDRRRPGRAARAGDARPRDPQRTGQTSVKGEGSSRSRERERRKRHREACRVTARPSTT
jgi:hypothetical protein